METALHTQGVESEIVSLFCCMFKTGSLLSVAEVLAELLPVLLEQERHLMLSGMILTSTRYFYLIFFSIAEVSKEPLYQVACGDISTSPEEVEKVTRLPKNAGE